ncbi:hypothetical protein ACEP22_27360 [Pseudomonas aeruginosa]|uniref:hypothetical protein n=1 Tax=Pseudomonas aeruginosa TaxID=287 RepID=UPI00071AFFC9|nr:hypothetical protein [Pseudomonas aeruginosa]KSC63426.1 hypothetical protein AO888_29200 [Pseudomonas aeruginosa]PUA13562.1 hypothetical protein DB390_13755 [Pseudomonas aeruginosa]HBO0872978.1 hypothetical protein [Pseudomonas aeruginosa]HBO2119829.1 hypothetical protein [Pseudomonas aeruginosa]HCL3448919.1 hypothetical protein [Pseudomonas aeruginosa]
MNHPSIIAGLLSQIRRAVPLLALVFFTAWAGAVVGNAGIRSDFAYVREVSNLQGHNLQQLADRVEDQRKFFNDSLDEMAKTTAMVLNTRLDSMEARLEAHGNQLRLVLDSLSHAPKPAQVEGKSDNVALR